MYAEDDALEVGTRRPLAPFGHVAEQQDLLRFAQANDAAQEECLTVGSVKLDAASGCRGHPAVSPSAKVKYPAGVGPLRRCLDLFRLTGVGCHRCLCRMLQ